MGLEPWPSFAPHSAAKAALSMLTKVFARALAPEVRVRDRARTGGGRAGAGGAAGGGIPARRVGTPDDVADAVVYLAGAGFVTGTTLVVDGGRSFNPRAASRRR